MEGELLRSWEELAGILPDTARFNEKGHLVIGGCDVADLAARFGTPLYIFDEETIRNRCREFRREFSSRYDSLLIIYAAKAFLCRALARIIREEGLGLDVVSWGEMAAALSSSFPPRLIYFHGNNKSPEELELALEQGVGRIVVDNLFELEILERIARSKGKVQEILLRLNPGIDPHTHRYIATGAADSKFGLPIAGGQAEEAVRSALSSPNLELLGFHVHIGSQIKDTRPFAEAARILIEFCARMREKYGFLPEELDLGGGFAIPYTRGEEVPSIGDYARAITSALRESLERFDLPAPRLVLEPGRAIVGRAGIALYRVGALKEIPGVRSYIFVDGGMGDNIRPALYQARYEAIPADKLFEPPKGKKTVAGRYCESGDILVRDAELPDLAPGDLIAVPVAGAYCIPMSSNYNHNPRPAIVMTSGGRAFLIRRRESAEDLLKLDLLPEEA